MKSHLYVKALFLLPVLMATVISAKAQDDGRAVYEGEVTILSQDPVSLAADGLRVFPGEVVEVAVQDGQTVDMNHRFWTERKCNSFLGIEYNCKSVPREARGDRSIDTAPLAVAMPSDGSRITPAEELVTSYAPIVLQSSPKAAERFDTDFTTPRRLLGRIVGGPGGDEVVSRVACKASTCSLGFYRVTVRIDVESRANAAVRYLENYPFVVAEIIHQNFLNANLRRSATHAPRISRALLKQADRFYPLNPGSGSDEDRRTILLQAEVFDPANADVQKALIDLYLDEGLYAEAEAQAGKAMKSVRARVESGEGATNEDFDLFVTAAAKSATVAMEKSLGNATLEVTEAVSHYDAAIWALRRWFIMRPTGEDINRERHRYADIQFKRAAALARFGTRESLREAESGLVSTMELFFDELAGYPVAADTPPHAFVARSSAPSFFTVENELVSIASLPGTADDRLASSHELGGGSSYAATVDEARVKVFNLADRSGPIATLDTEIERLHSAVRLAGGNILARSVDHNLHLISADGGSDLISEEGDAPLLLAVAVDTTQDNSDGANNRFLFGREGDTSLSKAENGAAVVKIPLNSDDDCFLATGGLRISPDGGRFAVAVRYGGVEGWIVAPWSWETLSCSSLVHTGPGDLTFTASGAIVIFDRTSGNLRTLENAQDGRWESRVLVDAPTLAGAPLSFLLAGEDTFALLDSSKELLRVELVHRPADGSDTKFASHSISPNYEPWSFRVTGLGFDPQSGRFIVHVLASARPGGLVAYVVPEASGVLPILEVATSLLGDDQQQQILLVDGPSPQLVWLDVNGALHRRMAGAEDDEELVSSLELERADTLLARAGEGWVEIAVDAEGIVLGVGWWRGRSLEPEAWGRTGSQLATVETEQTLRVEDRIGQALRSTVHDARPAWRPLSQRLTGRGVQVAGLWAEEPADDGARVISVLPLSNAPDAKSLRFTVASDAVPIGLLEPSGVLLTASDAEIAAYDVEGRLEASGLDGFSGADAEVLVGQGDRFAVFGVAGEELRLALFEVQGTGIEILSCDICDELAFDGLDNLLAGALSDMFRDGARPFVLSSDLQSIASLVQGGVRYGPISTPTFSPQPALPVYVSRSAGFFVRAPNRTEVRFLTASQLAAAANAQ